MIYEVRIHEDLVGWLEGFVCLEEEGGGDLWDFSYYFFPLLLGLLDGIVVVLVLLEARVAGADCSLYSGELREG